MRLQDKDYKRKSGGTNLLFALWFFFPRFGTQQDATFETDAAKIKSPLKL